VWQANDVGLPKPHSAVLRMAPLPILCGGSLENADNMCVFRMHTLLRNRFGVGMSGDKGCNFLEMTGLCSCKYRLISLHVSMLNDTASPVSIFVRFGEKIRVCHSVLQIKLSESVRKSEMNSRQARHHIIKQCLTI
jgi:hypothetical protein